MEGHRQRLKERFLNGGLEGFHDYEVIELLLSLNTPRKDCKQSAKKLMAQFETFQNVLEASPSALAAVKGVGPANILGLRLIKAVAERYLEQRMVLQDVVKNPGDLLDYLNQTIAHKNREVFAAVFLDAKNRVLKSRVLFEGTLSSSSVYPREVIINALEYHAAAVIFAHNHPSGDTEPSASDIRITRKLFFALRHVDITVHEHMIVGSKGFYSFAENGLIQKFQKEFEQLNEPTGN